MVDDGGSLSVVGAGILYAVLVTVDAKFVVLVADVKILHVVLTVLEVVEMIDATIVLVVLELIEVFDVSIVCTVFDNRYNRNGVR